MITSALGYVSVLLAICALLRYLEEHKQWRLFTYLPSVVLVYFVVMLAATFNVWQPTEAINGAYSALRNSLLPAMIVLMLLKADLRKIRQLGPRVLLAFFCASFTIGVAFVAAFGLFHSQLPADAWKTFAALSGSWMGGTGNMVAIQAALDVPNERMGYTLLIDSIDYSLWVMLLLALVPFAPTFARWTGADTSLLAQVSRDLNQTESSEVPVSTTTIMLVLAISLVCAALSTSLAQYLPVSDYFGRTAWTVMLVTLLGILAAMTPLSRYAASGPLSTVLLYLIIALIASRANFAQLTDAPLYILIGLIILLIHGTLMVLLAKLFRFDLFTCGVASLANIGGVASAPILAAAYSKSLIPVGVLMALLGYIVGTAGGLAVGRIMALF